MKIDCLSRCSAKLRIELNASEGNKKYSSDLMLRFSFCTDFAVDSACCMLAGEVPCRNLILVTAHIMYKRVSGQQ